MKSARLVSEKGLPFSLISPVSLLCGTCNSFLGLSTQHSLNYVDISVSMSRLKGEKCEVLGLET